jgi:hypothetical protein
VSSEQKNSYISKLAYDCMRKLLVMSFALLSIGLQAQDTPAGAVPVTSQEYPTCLANSANISAMGASGIGNECAATVANDDFFYQFTATSAGYKIEGTTAAFDMVLQVLDDGLNVVACENVNGAGSGEVLFVNNLLPGDHYIRVYSADGISGSGGFDLCIARLPEANLLASYTPFPSVDDGLPGYKITQFTSRNFWGYSVEATHWQFIDPADPGNPIENIVNGANGIVVLNSMPDLCFNKTYDVRVQVMVEGQWCGFNTAMPLTTEAEPVTGVSLAYQGGNYDLSDFISANFVGSGQLIEWEFASDNDPAFTFINPGNTNSSLVYFDDVPCIRYNTIYQVRVRAHYCSQVGSWSAPTYIIVSQIPHLTLWPEFCGESLYAGSTVICEYLDGVDVDYAWQIAPIEPGNPNVPIGPAIVTTTGFTSLYLLPLGLEYGQYYRIGVKALIGLNDGCGFLQEGDYGNFCVIQIIDPNALMAPDYRDFEIDASSSLGDISIYPNPSTARTLQVQMNYQDYEHLNGVDVYDLNGRKVLEMNAQEFSAGSGALTFDSELPNGLYVVRFLSDSGIVSKKLILE